MAKEEIKDTKNTEAKETKEVKKDTVLYTLPRNVLTDSKQKHKTVIVNGNVYQVQVGVPVEVPVAVKEVLENAIVAKYAADDMMNEVAEAATAKAKELN